MDLFFVDAEPALSLDAANFAPAHDPWTQSGTETSAPIAALAHSTLNWAPPSEGAAQAFDAGRFEGVVSVVEPADDPATRLAPMQPRLGNLQAIDNELSGLSDIVNAAEDGRGPAEPFPGRRAETRSEQTEGMETAESAEDVRRALERLLDSFAFDIAAYDEDETMRETLRFELSKASEPLSNSGDRRDKLMRSARQMDDILSAISDEYGRRTSSADAEAQVSGGAHATDDGRSALYRLLDSFVFATAAHDEDDAAEAR